MKHNFSSLFTSATICLLVGPAKKAYHLHQDALVSQCPYFRSRTDFQLKSSAPHGQEDPIHLNEQVDREDAFEMFIEYIYTLAYDLPGHLDHADACLLHARVYVLAERFAMDDLKLVALGKMNSLLEPADWSFPSVDLTPEVVSELIEIVYQGTSDKPRWFEVSDENTTNPTASVNTKIAQDDGALEENHYNLGSDPATTSDIDKDTETLDGMRGLLSRYAASKLGALRQNAMFMKGLTDGGQFVADLITALSFENRNVFVTRKGSGIRAFKRGKGVGTIDIPGWN